LTSEEWIAVTDSFTQTKSRDKIDAEKLMESIRRRPVLYECSRKKKEKRTEVAEELGEGVKGLYSSIFTRIKCE